MILGYLFEKEVTPQGTWFKCLVQDDLSESRLDRIQRDDGLWEVSIEIHDPRLISNEQRRLLYAMFRDISHHFNGKDYNQKRGIEQVKEGLKSKFIAECKAKPFSLSNADVTTAREFTEFVLEFMFEHAVPINQKMHTMAKEINNYLYLCLVYRRCAECGKRADIHHDPPIGKGVDRSTVDHTKYKLTALCRGHHNEAHQIGQETFNQKYHLDGIKVDQVTVRKLGL